MNFVDDMVDFAYRGTDGCGFVDRSARGKDSLFVGIVVYLCPFYFLAHGGMTSTWTIGFVH